MDSEPSTRDAADVVRAAIADRDADAAEAAVRVHMGRVIAELQEPGGSEIVAYTSGHCGRGSPDSEVLV